MGGNDAGIIRDRPQVACNTGEVAADEGNIVGRAAAGRGRHTDFTRE